MNRHIVRAVAGAALAGVLQLLWLARAQAEPAARRVSLVEVVQRTLALHPEIKLQRQLVETYRSVREVEQGEFDYQLRLAAKQSGKTTPLSARQQALRQQTQVGAVTAITTHTTSYDLGLAKRFRWGMSVTPSINVARSAVTQDVTTGVGQIVFSVVQPLLRGRGASSAAADETAASIEEQATVFELQHVIAGRIAATALAYWTYAAANEMVSIFRQGEVRARALLEEQQTLVAAKQLPEADLKQVEAKLAEARAARMEAESEYVEAQQALGLAIGLPWQEVSSLPPPRESLEVMSRISPLPSQQVAALIERAMHRRADRAALRESARAAGVLTYAARRNLEPELNFQLDLGYTGLSEGSGVAPFFAPLAERVEGVNFVAGLSLGLPLGNRAARGLLGQRQAESRRVAIMLRELERQIGVNISTAVSVLRASVDVLAQAEQAAAAYRDAVDNERKKLRAGLSTIFDVILSEGLLTAAEVRVTRAQVRVAQAVTQLRYETATLTELQSRGTAVITRESIMTVPR